MEFHQTNKNAGDVTTTPEFIAELIEQAVLKEREECAKVAEEFNHNLAPNIVESNSGENMTPAERSKDILSRLSMGMEYRACEDIIRQAIFSAVIDEREACAKIADSEWNAWGQHDDKADVCKFIANAIRDRGK